MSYKAWSEWSKTREKIAMSQKVGKLKEFKSMQQTACVHINEREVIALCRIYQMINPEDKDFNKYLTNVAIPSLIVLGRSRWYRDTITDLGFALSGTTVSSATEDTKKILEVEIEK